MPIYSDKPKDVTSIGDLQLNPVINPDYKEELLAVDRNHRQNLQMLVSGIFPLRSYRTAHAETWDYLGKSTRDKSFRFLENQTLLDLSGGEGKEIAQIAADYKVKLLCNVDILPHENAWSHVREHHPTLNYQFIDEDMLSLLSRTPSESVAVSINGIDQCIIPSESYHQLLAKELKRVVKPGAIVFGVQSSVMNLLKGGEFEVLYEQTQMDPGAAILKKHS